MKYTFEKAANGRTDLTEMGDSHSLPPPYEALEVLWNEIEKLLHEFERVNHFSVENIEINRGGDAPSPWGTPANFSVGIDVDELYDPETTRVVVVNSDLPVD